MFVYDNVYDEVHEPGFLGACPEPLRLGFDMFAAGELLDRRSSHEAPVEWHVGLSETQRRTVARGMA